MTMATTSLTHRDLARMLGVSETTIKSYRRKFPGCIPVASNGKPIRFTEEAGQVCVKIRELFSRGMSVEEVRLRLETYFDWIPPYEPEETQSEEQHTPVVSSSVDMPEDFTLAVSNLAKGMVKLTMQQETMLKKMASIDARLEQLGLYPKAVEGISEPSSLTPELSQWMQQAHTVLERIEMLAGQVIAEPKVQAKVVRVKNSYGDVSEYHLETDTAAESTEGVPQEVVSPQPLPPQDPPRRLLTLPLVIQSEDGDFLGVAGKSRGRFSINDFKAMLMAHFSSNERYSYFWQLTPNGWLLALEQKDAEVPKNLAFVVEQKTTPRGNDVALIQHVTINGVDEETSQVHAFIRAIYEA